MGCKTWKCLRGGRAAARQALLPAASRLQHSCVPSLSRIPLHTPHTGCRSRIPHTHTPLWVLDLNHPTPTARWVPELGSYRFVSRGRPQCLHSQPVIARQQKYPCRCHSPPRGSGWGTHAPCGALAELHAALECGEGPEGRAVHGIWRMQRAGVGEGGREGGRGGNACSAQADCSCWPAEPEVTECERCSGHALPWCVQHPQSWRWPSSCGLAVLILAWHGPV